MLIQIIPEVSKENQIDAIHLWQFMNNLLDN